MFVFLPKICYMHISALARKIKGQGNFANLRVPNAQLVVGEGSGRGLAPAYLNKNLFENKA